MESKRVRPIRTVLTAATLSALALVATAAVQTATTESHSVETQNSAKADGPTPGDIDWG